MVAPDIPATTKPRRRQLPVARSASVVALLVIDLTVGTGRDAAFIAGGAIGFGLSAWYTFSRNNIADHPLDVSMFWLVGLLGVAGYLLTALVAKNTAARR